jgi:hypothetical protein
MGSNSSSDERYWYIIIFNCHGSDFILYNDYWYEELVFSYTNERSFGLAHAVFYLFASFREIMPWSICTHSWNTHLCSERMQNQTLDYMNRTKISSAEEYYNIYMLGINHSQGLTDLGSIKIDLLLCLILIFILMYMCIYRGVKGTGKINK